MATKKTDDDTPKTARMRALAGFSSAKHEGDVRAGAPFETTPERAEHLEKVLKIAVPAD